MKTLTHGQLGGAGTPQDIKDLRQSSFDFHETLGFPVLFKHRWTEKDLREGLAQQCPLHDDLYDTDTTWDNVCFGTGYIGGYRDAEIVYVSLSDAPQDTIKITPQGLLQYDHHPQMTAPWLPTMQDGDLIILATFDPETWDILDLSERYVLQQVNQTTMRGPGYQRRGHNAIGKPFVVHQETSIDKLPYGHPLYEVPIVFDYENVEPDVTKPGDDPYDPSEPGTYTEHTINLRIRGAEIRLQSSVNRELRLAVAGSPDLTERDICIVGEPADGSVVFHW